MFQGTADAWYAQHEAWPEVVHALRALLVDAGLVETVKWSQPCYMDGDRNVAIVGTFKHCGQVSFFQGVFLDDPRGLLVQPGQTRASRYLPFTTAHDVQAEAAYVRGLIAQAVEVARSGQRLPPLPDTLDPVDTLQQRLDADDVFRDAFEALTPGRQRQYNHHLASAKRPATREARLDACLARILAGKGLTDCVCGRSKRMPRCDGSHRTPSSDA